MYCSPPYNRREKEHTFAENYQCCTSGNNIRTVILDFGRVSVDDNVMKTIKICNGSCNEESFEVHKDPITNPLDAVFHFQKYSWTAEPKSTIICQILYRPFLPFQRSVDYFTIVNCDREILKLIVRGESIGPNIVISSEKLVMICRPGGSVKKRVKMTNNSDVPANFMFDVDERQSSFKPNSTEGCVDANSHVYVFITFTPMFEGLQALYLPCLIQHQAPIMIQIYGYCGKKYTKEEQFHIPILVYPRQKNSGFGSYMSDTNQIRSGNAQLAAYPISLSNNYLDFERVEVDLHDTALRPPQITCFTNHSQSDMVVKWQKDVDSIFEITSNNVRVKAKDTCLFEIRFHPTEENTFYTRELMASVFCINSEDSEPDYSYAVIASIRVMGHTFPVDSSSWIPQYQIPRTVIMPACLPSRPAYATFLIRRFGHLPLMFHFIPPTETHFIVKPMLGVIHKNYQIIVVKMYPGELHSELLYERWTIRLNGNPDYEISIDFRGYAEYPCLNFRDVVNFPPTHPGCENIKSVSMRNTSRHNITYRYEDLPSVLNVDQIHGKIYANEILMHNWRFKPIEEGYYALDFSCNFAAMTKSQENELIMENRLHVTGKSECGYLVAIPNELNFGEQRYDETKKLDFQLINPCSVEIPYTLMVSNNAWPYEGESTQQNVLIDPRIGILRSGESVKIEVSLTPQKSGFHECTIEYSIRLNSETEEIAAMNNPMKICRIKYFCVLPTIKVEDLLHHGMVPNINKYVLWRLLNVKKLNMILNNVQPGEKDDLEMHFPPMVVQDDAVVVKLLITNPTSTLATWSLKRIKSCSCPTAKEKHSLNFQLTRFNCPHRNLCTMNPKSGTLKAHENIVITTELHYEILGETNLKWNLNIGHNREVCLYMKITAFSANEQKAILLYGPRFDLKKIYIGDKDPVNQICWIYNPTQNDIAYSLDTTAFKKVNEEHRSELFSCENPSGTVRGFSHEPVFIKFKPRRWGIFEIVVPLMLGDEKTSITIKGECTNDPFARISEEISPSRDAFHIPEVPVYFNTDHITLPPIPMHSRVIRMTMIHNNLEHEVIAYKWKRFEIPGIIKINIEPQTGRIQPASLQTCRLMIVTGGKPCKLNADVTCEFINQSKIRDYEKEIFLYNSLCEEVKDYFTITEKGTSVPKPKDLVLKAPKPFQKSLTVRCYIYSPQDERMKIPWSEKIKHTPEIEIPVEKGFREISASRETIALSTFILEGMIWNVLQTVDTFASPTASIKYSQIVVEPLHRRKIQERSYVKPSGRILEKLLENMIFMIVHKEFALGVIHLPQTTDARQAAYQKMWQQVPKQKGLESSPKI